MLTNTARSLPGAVRAGLVAVVCFVCFNVNGRELGTSDSQPSKFLAREILTHAHADARRHRRAAAGRRTARIRPDRGRPLPLRLFHRSRHRSGGRRLAAGGAAHHRSRGSGLSPNPLAKLTASSFPASRCCLRSSRRGATRPMRCRPSSRLGFGLGTNIWALASRGCGSTNRCWPDSRWRCFT